MLNFTSKKIRAVAIIILLLIPISLTSALFVYTFFLPEKINVKIGQESTIDFFIPFKAEINPDNVQVLSVNSQPVTENIKLDFSEPATFLANSKGKWNMTLSLYGLPIKTVSVEAIEKQKLVAGGEIVGIKVKTNGVLVLGTGDVKANNGKYIDPSNGKIKTGDLIKYVNNIPINTKEDLIKTVENSTEKLNLTIFRDKNKMQIEITPVISQEDNKKKLGIWVRDSTQGIGTITYYDNTTKTFGALGHPITDIDTGELMEISSGNIYSSKIVEIKKGSKGNPGQITGEILGNKVLGDIKDNNDCGIYGITDKKVAGKEYEIAVKNQVKPGKAVILSCIDGELRTYNIEILAINTFNKNDSKGMIIKIIDEELLQKTGGIIQGMSGSPIVQNNKLVGAVTHVFVNDPTKGYGIFIENML